MAQHAEQRSTIYGFLATVYRKELSLDVLHQIKIPQFQKVLSDLGVQLGDEFFSKPEKKLIEALAVEYTRLFLGPGKHISPHESIHHQRDRGTWGQLWGESTVEVKKFVESLGLQYKENDTSIPDHISVELEMMQKVIAEEGRAWTGKGKTGAIYFLKIENMFMKDHLMKWVPQFCDKVISNADLSFYREMAKLTKSFIEFEEKEIDKYVSEG